MFDAKLDSNQELNIKNQNDESSNEVAEKDSSNPSKSRFFPQNTDYDEKISDEKIQFLNFNQEQIYDSNSFFLNHNNNVKQGIFFLKTRK